MNKKYVLAIAVLAFATVLVVCGLNVSDDSSADPSSDYVALKEKWDATMQNGYEALSNIEIPESITINTGVDSKAHLVTVEVICGELSKKVSFPDEIRLDLREFKNDLRTMDVDELREKYGPYLESMLEKLGIDIDDIMGTIEENVPYEGITNYHYGTGVDDIMGTIEENVPYEGITNYHYGAGVDEVTDLVVTMIDETVTEEQKDDIIGAAEYVGTELAVDPASIVDYLPDLVYVKVTQAKITKTVTVEYAVDEKSGKIPMIPMSITLNKATIEKIIDKAIDYIEDKYASVGQVVYVDYKV